MSERRKASVPEDITAMFVERVNEGDADGVAELYEEHAVIAHPPGERTEGSEAIRTPRDRGAGQYPTLCTAEFITYFDQW